MPTADLSNQEPFRQRRHCRVLRSAPSSMPSLLLPPFTPTTLVLRSQRRPRHGHLKSGASAPPLRRGRDRHDGSGARDGVGPCRARSARVLRLRGSGEIDIPCGIDVPCDTCQLRSKPVNDSPRTNSSQISTAHFPILIHFLEVWVTILAK